MLSDLSLKATFEVEGKEVGEQKETEAPEESRGGGCKVVPRKVAGRLRKERLEVSEITVANFSHAKDAQYRMGLFWREENGD